MVGLRTYLACCKQYQLCGWRNSKPCLSLPGSGFSVVCVAAPFMHVLPDCFCSCNVRDLPCHMRWLLAYRCVALPLQQWQRVGASQFLTWLHPAEQLPLWAAVQRPGSFSSRSPACHHDCAAGMQQEAGLDACAAAQTRGAPL